jgi:hypothetical protein
MRILHVVPRYLPAAAVHLTSKIEAEELDKFGWRLPRLAIIGNGVDEPRTMPLRLGQTSRPS